MNTKSSFFDYKKKILNQYNYIIENCNTNLKNIEKNFPDTKEDFYYLLKKRKISRRNFIKWTSFITMSLMLPSIFNPLVIRAAENFHRIPIIWLHFSECTGCSEAFLRSSYPNVDDILFETISLEYHETLMAAAGYQAEENLKNAMNIFQGKFICVIEGAIPVGLNGYFCRMGSKNKTSIEIVREVTSKAAFTICIGSCSSFGNIPAAKPNPTNAVGVNKIITSKIVNIAGCPPNVINFTGTILHYLMFGSLPPLDSLYRPLWAYGKRIHDFCERHPHYDAGEFVQEWGDYGSQKNWCLYKMGCKGPYTFANCSKVRFNDGISWPIMSGHGCIGCTEPNFWDNMAPLEKPIANKIFPGIENTVDKMGIILTTATVTGITAHAVTTVINKNNKKLIFNDKNQGEKNE